MAPIRKDALQEVVNERMAKQGNKSAKQLYMDKANKKTAKVSYFGDFTKVEKVDLSYIPGREKRKEDPRAKKLAMKKEKEEAARMKKAQTDWTETDEFGNIIMSVEAQVLELASIRDASTDNRVGPIYPRGKRIECLDLGVPLENANSNTFEVLKPKKRSDYDPDESRRYPLAKLPDDKKPFTLVEKEASEVTINPQTGTIDVTDVHINACAVKDDDLFTVGRSLQRSNVPQVVITHAPKVDEKRD